MKITCRYSGITFRAEFFDEYSVVGEHPIFQWSMRRLIMLAPDWKAGKFSETQRKLLFLALLKKTDSVVFDVPAFPEPKVVSRCMSSLFRLLGDNDIIESGMIKLPHYRITPDTADLRSIDQWISKWFEEKNAWFHPSLARRTQELLGNRGRLIERLMRDPSKISEQYAGRLASQAMIQADVPENKREYWTKLFKLRDNEIFLVPIEHIYELLSHMETHLYVSVGFMAHRNFDIAENILQHLRDIKKRAEGGRIGDFGGDDYFSILEDNAKGEYNPNRLRSTTSTEEYNIRLTAAGAPDLEPNKRDYPNRLVDFIKDHSRWKLAQRVKVLDEREQLRPKDTNNRTFTIV